VSVDSTIESELQDEAAAVSVLAARYWRLAESKSALEELVLACGEMHSDVIRRGLMLWAMAKTVEKSRSRRARTKEGSGQHAVRHLSG
jgi:hypothetical protein